MMEIDPMIPYHNVWLSQYRDDGPAIPVNYTSLLDEMSAIGATEFGGLAILDTPHFDYERSYIKSYDHIDIRSVVRYNCKLSGCDSECAKGHFNDLFDDWESPFDRESQLIYGFQDMQPYTPDNDHSYYASAFKQTFVSSLSDMDDKMDVLKNIPTPPSTSESPSETSSEDEVDVVTVPEEYLPPVMPKYDHIPRRSTRTPRLVKKPQRVQQEPTLSAKSLKAAMKRTRIQSNRRPYRRRKLNNSVETTPSSSTPSSGRSSQCNSDIEGESSSSSNSNKAIRHSHNSSERKRREVQRAALQNLRVCIPDLQGNSKAPKVLILNSATSLVRKLQNTEQTLEDIKFRESQRKSDLQAKLNQLRMRLKMKKAV